MQMQKLIHQIHTKVEHRLRHLGLYGGVSLAFIAVVVWYFDTRFVSADSLISFEQTEKLTNINNVLASVLIAILLTTFSVVFVVMQLASSQFSPRILRHFLYSDIRIQQFIGWFLGALAFIFIPQILAIALNSSYLQLSVIVALVINGYSILVSFPGIISHLSDNMNISALTHRIKQEVLNEIAIAYPSNWQKGDALTYQRYYRDRTKDYVNLVWSGNSGYLSQVNYNRFQDFVQTLASGNDLSAISIYQKPIVGEFVLAQVTSMLNIVFDTPVTPLQKDQILAHWVKFEQEVFVVNKYRSYTQDINFGVRKLVDIGIKAISPAVNDPTTCINCIDYLGEIVRTLAIKKFPTSRALALRTNRIYVNEFDFDELVDFCFGQIQQWGKHDPIIIKRIVSTLRAILTCVQNPFHLSVLIREVEDMELERVYSPANEKKNFTKEQIQTIQGELSKFKKKALQQIERMQNDGRLEGTEQDNECLNWLKLYYQKELQASKSSTSIRTEIDSK
jgi:uncharacterized membrane protein